MIPFNKPPLTGNEQKYVLQSMQSDKISGDGYFGKRCQSWFENELNCNNMFLHAGELTIKQPNSGNSLTLKSFL